MTEIDMMEWLENRVPASTVDIRMNTMAMNEIDRLRKRVSELERQLDKYIRKDEGIISAYE